MARPHARLYRVEQPRAPLPRAVRARRPLGDVLTQMGVLDSADLARALALQTREDLRLGDIMLAHGMITEKQLMRALSIQYQALPVDLVHQPPDPRLIDAIGVETCLHHGAVPVHRLGGATVIATARPDAFAQLCRALPDRFDQPIMALCHEHDLHQALIASRDSKLVRKAETRVSPDLSCRYWYQARPRQVLLALTGLLILAALLAPRTTLLVLTGLCLLSLCATTGLKAAAALTSLRRQTPRTGPAPQIARLPVVSALVPLLREEDIAARLIERLETLQYPKELLDICLVIEADDSITAQMLQQTRLPHWMRVIRVPKGGLKTKPRALNFALDFCRGAIIGIYDAEDKPDPDQIHRIVRTFHERPPRVACVQGVLDFYNTRCNWISRCFTMEYASWFRLVLPGVARLGLAVPLGGTTCFFRRDALEELGAWDAHNVTEDADIGIRLARHGYQTEVISSVTHEEANSRLLPWIKQRSRWLKGFAMTWSSHMRRPRQLLRQMGWRQFIGFQVMFAGTLCQFMLAPLMWSFWTMVLGFEHPLQDVLPGWILATMVVLFLSAETINIALAICGARAAGKPGLYAWAPSMHLYYPMAAFAMYKALFEMVVKPFYWDKTQHGISDEIEDAPYSSEA